MGDVLSQNEIDSLLAALTTGELDVEEIKENNEKQVKNYDFARPSKFSKEHLRTLEIIFEHYGRLLSTNLPVYLRKNVQVEVMNSEAVTYSEFSNALSNPVLLGIVNFAPLQGNIIIEMASSLGYCIVDRMLGGRGEPMDKVREWLELMSYLIMYDIEFQVEEWEGLTCISKEKYKKKDFAELINHYISDPKALIFQPVSMTSKRTITEEIKKNIVDDKGVVKAKKEKMKK